ncbi:MAG: NAD(P)H-dependent oxidoreductase [Cyanobacteria bacterium REEB67]|nr:NAD(P)H-dependent oxidoreductase [Cyanobacteria bacterium REEB67]
MTQILHVDSSSRSSTSVTRQLSRQLVNVLQKAHPQASLVERDLIDEQPHFVSELDISAVYTPAEQRSDAQNKAWDAINGPLQTFIDSDIYVFGVPMYNFSVPAVFKAFIDRSVIAGRTFAYSADGLKPLLQNKKAYVVTASGGDYELPGAKAMDFVEPYLRAVFGFIGIGDITFIKVPGHSEAEIEASKARALAQIEAIGAASSTHQTATAGV